MTNWLDPLDVKGTAFYKDPEKSHPGLPLGTFDGTSTPVNYYGRAHMMTVAPSGAGKSQCLALPMLWGWPGSVIVLDVKGELYYHTAGWREKGLGQKVYRFDPDDPKSDKFNPLAYISTERFEVQTDVKDIARVIAPVGAKEHDPFWKQRAQEVIETAIHIQLHQYPYKINLANVIERISNISSLRQGLDTLIEGGDTEAGARHKSYQLQSVRNMARGILTQLFERDGGLNRTGQGVFSTINAQIASLNTEQIIEITQKSDWNPLDLRHGDKTVYITLPPKAKGQYREIMALVMNAHINALMARLPEQNTTPLLLLLDEMPQLGRMKAIEQVIDLGRAYGVLLAGFCQRRQQLEDTYGNAGDFLGTLETRLYMNPSPEDGSGELLVKALGKKKDAWTDNTPEDAATLNEICGPKFRNSIIALSRGSLPANISKTPAYDNTAYDKHRSFEAKHAARYAPMKAPPKKIDNEGV